MIFVVSGADLLEDSGSSPERREELLTSLRGVEDKACHELDEVEAIHDDEVALFEDDVDFVMADDDPPSLPLLDSGSSPE